MKVRLVVISLLCFAAVLLDSPRHSLAAPYFTCYDQVLMYDDEDLDSIPDAGEWKGHATSPTNDPPEMTVPREAAPVLDTRASHPNWLPTWYASTSWAGEAYHPGCTSEDDPDEEEGAQNNG